MARSCGVVDRSAQDPTETPFFGRQDKGGASGPRGLQHGQTHSEIPEDKGSTPRLRPPASNGEPLGPFFLGLPCRSWRGASHPAQSTRPQVFFGEEKAVVCLNWTLRRLSPCSPVEAQRGDSHFSSPHSSPGPWEEGKLCL